MAKFIAFASFTVAVAANNEHSRKCVTKSSCGTEEYTFPYAECESVDCRPHRCHSLRGAKFLHPERCEHTYGHPLPFMVHCDEIPCERERCHTKPCEDKPCDSKDDGCCDKCCGSESDDCDNSDYCCNSCCDESDNCDNKCDDKHCTARYETEWTAPYCEANTTDDAPYALTEEEEQKKAARAQRKADAKTVEPMHPEVREFMEAFAGLVEEIEAENAEAAVETLTKVVESEAALENAEQVAEAAAAKKLENQAEVSESDAARTALTAVDTNTTA